MTASHAARVLWSFRTKEEKPKGALLLDHDRTEIVLGSLVTRERFRAVGQSLLSPADRIQVRGVQASPGTATVILAYHRVRCLVLVLHKAVWKRPRVS